MRNKIIIVYFLTAVLLLSGCSRSGKEESSVSADETTDLIVNTPNVIRYIDAHGEWHELTVNPDVKKHDYDWSLLSNSGQDVSYKGSDAYNLKKGIDVSEYQGAIDWKKVRAAGYEFAIIRMAYRGYGEAGTLVYDATYIENIQEAQAAGLDVGVYIFSQAISEEEALEEAALVIAGLKAFTLELPVVFDPEEIKDDVARTDGVSGEQFTRNTLAFCEAVKKAGYTPMVYSNLVWESEFFDMPRLDDYTFWYADYEKIPQTPYAFSFWQFSEKGSVPGIEGNVDLNVWFVPSDC